MAAILPFIIGAIVAIAAIVILRPRPPEVKPAALDEFNFPTAETGKPVPVIFGTVTLRSPNVVWYGDLKYTRVRSGGQKIGYKYYLGMHLIFCHGDIDELKQLTAGNKIFFTGSVTSNQTLNIDQAGLFGGRKKQGGIQGPVDVEFGAVDQPQNSYLQGVLGSNDIPAFRGNFGLVLNQVYVTAITTTIQPWAATLRRQPAATWYPATANINNGSANPAHIIYEALTNKDWGLGLPVSDVDDANFRAAADTLFAENFGLSFPYVQQNQVEEFIQTVGSHINALILLNKFTGRFNIRLFREDYVVGDLPIYDNSNCELQKFERPSPSDLINEINLVYRERGAIVDNSISLQDLASIEAQGNIVSQTVNYPGIDNAELAARVADRDLLQLASPLVTVRLKTNREAFQLTEGDLIRLNYTSDSINVTGIVLRITEVNLGTIDRSEIILNAVEDVFSVGTATYLVDQANQWIDPVGDPVESADRTLLELNFNDVANFLGAAEATTLMETSAYVKSRVGLPSVASPNYEFFTALSPSTIFTNVDIGEYPPTATLFVDIGQTDTTIQINATNVTAFDVEDIELGSYIGVDDELMQVTAFDFTLNPPTITVVRGIIDSVPALHTAGTTVYFEQNFYAIDNTRYEAGQTIQAKIAVETGIAQLPLDTITIDSLLFVGRINKPFPPANIRYNGNLFPGFINALSSTSISWTQRNRIAQATDLIGWFDTTNIPFEIGTTVTIELYGETNNLIRTETDLVTTFVYSPSTEQTDSNLTTNATNRDLVTTGLAVASTETVYTGITDSVATILINTAFRRMTNDWALFHREANYHLNFVNGTTGARTTSSVTPAQWDAITQNSSTPFDGRTDAELILAEQAGQQAGWAAVVPNIAFTTVAPDAVDRTFQSIIDHRETSDQLIVGFTSESSFNFVANGQSAIKGLAFFSHSVHFISRTNLTSGTFATTRRLVEEFYSGNNQVLDDATVPSSSLANPTVESPYSGYNLIPVRPFWGGVTFGSLLYINFRGFGSTSFSTVGKFLDIKNLLNADITTIYDSHRVITKKYTVSGNTITEVSRFTDFVFADRSNVADTQGVEWEGTDMRLVNSSTGAVTNTFSKFEINALACDWVDGHVYVVRRSDLAVVKIDLTGTDIGTFSDPGFIAGPGNSHLYIADGLIYARAGINVIQIQKDLLASQTTLLSPELIRPTFAISGLPIDARPDSSIIHNWNDSQKPDLYDETGGQSPATPIPQPRLNTTLRTDIKSVRNTEDSFRTFTNTIQRSGYGYNYGNFYGE